MSSRNWCFTLNNYSPEEEESIQNLDTKYLVYGREIGEALTPHLQGTVVFHDKIRLTAAKKRIPRAHFERTKVLHKSIEYCKKDGNVFEKGEMPLTMSQAAKKGIAERWDLARQGRFEELPPENIKTYEYIFRKNLPCRDRDQLLNEWRYGESGAGKSSGVRKEYGESLYVKDTTKWWDGYAGEETVLIEDWDPKTTEYLSRYLKIWSDHYCFKAEVKGGSMEIRPRRIVVTSQYPIDGCFLESNDLSAIARRFVEMPIYK